MCFPMFLNVANSNLWLKLNYSFKFKFYTTFIVSCHIRSYKTCIKNYFSKNSPENFTTINLYVQLMLKNIIMVDYPIVRAVG